MTPPPSRPFARAARSTAAPVYVPQPGAYAVANYLMPTGAVLQARWYARTDDVTLQILPASQEGA